MNAIGGFAGGYAGAVDDKKRREMLERLESQGDSGGYGAGNGPTGYSLAGETPPTGGYGSAVVPGATSPTSVEAQTIREGLIKRGMAPHIAEGFVLNFQDESALNTSAVGDNGNAFGLAQWNGPRMRGLQSFAKERGVSASNTDLQLDYLMHELTSNEAGSYTKIQRAKTPGEAAAYVLNHFERPAEVHRARREKAYLGHRANPEAEHVAMGTPEQKRAAIVATVPGADRIAPARLDEVATTLDKEGRPVLLPRMGAAPLQYGAAG